MSSNKKCSGKNHRMDGTIDPYEALANAIIRQAVNDCRRATNLLVKKPNDANKAKQARTQHTYDECLKFFRSKWFGVLTDVRPELLVRKLDEEKKWLMIRVALKKLYESIALRRAVQRCGRYGNQ